jgi:hypothetical protein
MSVGTALFCSENRLPVGRARRIAMHVANVASLWFPTALATLLASIVSAFFAFKSEHNRKLRCELRKLLKHRLANLPDVAEREFAHVISSAIRHSDFQRLKKLSVEKYVSGYSGDPELFPPRLSDFLKTEVHKNSAIDSAVLDETLKAIDGWRVSKQLVEGDILSYLKQIEMGKGPQYNQVKRVRSFIKTRDEKYFEIKTNEFVDNVKKAVIMACRS